MMTNAEAAIIYEAILFACLILSSVIRKNIHVIM